MECKYCKGRCIKAGFQKNGVQKFYCKACKKYQQAVYTSEAYHPQSNYRIAALLREGIGLRSMARVLRISLKTIIQRIRQIAGTIRKPFHYRKRGVYEMDELWSYVGKKSNEVWIMYALDRATKAVIDFRVGSRTKKNIQTLTGQVLHREPKTICTDGLNIYKSLVPKKTHCTEPMSTRHIERNNLTIRTHLKRLSRRTICFSKSMEMLEACLKIYFWKGERLW
ncbi:MAG: IS1 family transposase [Cyclobacteriaceae bacterium]|nr:IS1 family transposase [Cyclobacteriaceae bacterium]